MNSSLCFYLKTDFSKNLKTRERLIHTNKPDVSPYSLNRSVARTLSIQRLLRQIFVHQLQGGISQQHQPTGQPSHIESLLLIQISAPKNHARDCMPSQVHKMMVREVASNNNFLSTMGFSLFHGNFHVRRIDQNHRYRGQII